MGRELENAVERAVIMATGNEIDAGDIYFEGPVEAEAAPSAAEPVVAAPLDGDLRAREKHLIVEALQDVKGSRKEAAQRLGISPRTLRYKLARLKEQGVAIPSAG